MPPSAPVLQPHRKKGGRVVYYGVIFCVFFMLVPGTRSLREERTPTSTNSLLILFQPLLGNAFPEPSPLFFPRGRAIARLATRASGDVKSAQGGEADVKNQVIETAETIAVEWAEE